MLSYNLSGNTNNEGLSASNTSGTANTQAVNVSMSMKVTAKQQGKKIKSQRACNVKHIQQQVNNYTGGNIINELNNLQLIHQQIMRNKSNTSRGTKGSAQYREQLLNLNQTSQSSINPQNYLTSKRKSPKLAQKLNLQKQLQNMIADELKQNIMAKNLVSQKYSQQSSQNQHQLTPHNQIQQNILR